MLFKKLHELLHRGILLRAQAKAGLTHIPPAFGVGVAMVLIGASGKDSQQADSLEVVAEDIVAAALKIEWFHAR